MALKEFLAYFNVQGTNLWTWKMENTSLGFAWPGWVGKSAQNLVGGFNPFEKY